MNEQRKAYVIVAANVRDLPCEIPAWLLIVVDGLARARDAILEVEHAASVVIGGGDTARSKAERCFNLFEAFTRDHGEQVRVMAEQFAVRRRDLPEDLARSLGVELGLAMLSCANLAFRGRILKQFVDTWTSENDAMATVGSRCMAEACAGQGSVLDWISASLVGHPPPAERSA
jgi:hypothetical protein